MEIGEVRLKGTTYVHTIRGKEIPMVRGYVPLEELAKQMPPEEAQAVQEVADLISGLLTEGGAIVSNGTIVNVGLGAIPMDEFARKRVQREGILKIPWIKARDEMGVTFKEGVVDGNKRVYFFGDGVVREMSLRTFKADSVALRHPSPYRSVEPYLHDLQGAFGNLVQNVYKERGVQKASFPPKAIATSSMLGVFIASRPQELPRQSRIRSQQTR